MGFIPLLLATKRSAAHKEDKTLVPVGNRTFAFSEFF
jgi:hypothetical protein